MSNTVEFKIKISDISGDAIKNIRASIEGVDGVVEQLTQSVHTAGGALREAANEAFRWNQVKEVLSGVTEILDQITAPARQFNQAMREANTMAGKGEQDFRRLKSAVSELSTEIPVARDLLARGLYQTISNGVPEGNWIEFLDRSAKSAVGGIANLEKVVTVTSTVIKNYGLSWDEAGAIQDKIQTTAKNGVTSFEQLADALPRVSGNAATLGVSIDDLMATFATLTGVSGNTAEVSTQLAAIFTALVKPSSEATKMAEQMGVEFNAMSIKAAGGLIPFLENLNTRIDDYAASSGMLREEIYGMLFGSAEALRAIIPLTGELGAKFVENSELMADSAGAINTAFEQMNSTADAVSQRLSNWVSGFSDMAAAIVGTSAPYITFVAQTVTAVTQIKAFTVVVRSFTAGIMSSKAALAIKTVAMNVATAASNLYKIALVKLTAVFGSARIAAAALAVTMTLGLSVAIYAVIELVSRLMNKTQESTQVMDVVGQASAKAGEEFDAQRAKIEALRAVLQNSQTAYDERLKALNELKSIIPDYNAEISKEGAIYNENTTAINSYLKTLEKEIKLKALKERLEEAYRKKFTQEKIARPVIEAQENIIRTSGNPQEVENARRIIDSLKEVDREIASLEDQINTTSLIGVTTGEYEPLTDEKRGGESVKTKQKEIAQDDELSTWGFDKKVKEILGQNAKAYNMELKPVVLPIDMQKVLDLPDGGLQLDLEARLKGLDDVKSEIQHLQSLMSVAQTDDEKRAISGKIKGLQSYADQFEKTNNVGENTSRVFAGIGNIFSTLSGTVEEGAGAWLNYAGGVISAISQMIPALAAVATGQAIAGATSLPPPFNFIQLGLSLAAVAAAFASIPKFADGGIAYGATLGIFGEYSGAANNPEVVAPLNKLRSLIEPQGGTGEVTFRIEGRTLVGILNKMHRINSRIG